MVQIFNFFNQTLGLSEDWSTIALVMTIALIIAILSVIIIKIKKAMRR